MAKEEHLEILKQGVDVWNRWREENECIKPNLSSAKLCKISLRDIDLHLADLSNAVLIKVDLSYADLTRSNLSNATLLEVDLSNATLICSCFQNASFSSTIFCNAILSYSNFNGSSFSEADLSYADLSNTVLKNADLSCANLSGVNLFEANLSYTTLSNSNLRNAVLLAADLTFSNLSHANLRNADLNFSNFSNAILNQANLRAVQALHANFEQASLTGACIADWNTNFQTNLKDVKCDYIYLQYSRAKKKFFGRRPHDSTKSFAPGEFTKRFQQILETVDLFFDDGIDWRAFLTSFQELQIQHGDKKLSVQGIERKSGGGFEVRLAVSPEVDKAVVEREAYQKYETNLKILEARYRAELQAKGKEIESYRRESANMMEITKLLASRPINVGANAVANDQSKKITYNQQGAKFNNFAADGGTATGGTFHDFSQNIGQNIDEIAALIESLRRIIQQFPEEKREDALLELDDLQADIKTPEKQEPNRISRRLKRLLAAGTAVAAIASGTATFSGDINEFTSNVLELSEKLGIPIEQVQP